MRTIACDRCPSNYFQHRGAFWEFDDEEDDGRHDSGGDDDGQDYTSHDDDDVQ